MKTTTITPHMRKAFWARVIRGEGCWTYRVRGNDSPTVQLIKRGKHIHVAVMAYFLIRGTWAKDLPSLCGNDLCCRVSHHRALDFKPRHRPTWKEKERRNEEMWRRFHEEGATHEELAEAYGLCWHTIYGIVGKRE